MPRISVVIPALNEEKYIGKTLEGLKKQTFKDFEIIVADASSTDNTRKIAEAYAKVVVHHKKGAAGGRNEGAKVAKGDIIVFVDADTVPSDTLLDAYNKAFTDNIVAATGPILPLEKTGFGVRLGYKFVSDYLVRLSILINKDSIIGSNFAVKKSIFDKIGGFDEKFLTYEDLDLSLKLRKYGRIAFVKRAMIYASARRITKWGMSKYFLYHTGNMVRYNLTKKPKSDYDTELIR